jgi:hypothetical protein
VRARFAAAGYERAQALRPQLSLGGRASCSGMLLAALGTHFRSTPTTQGIFPWVSFFDFAAMGLLREV